MNNSRARHVRNVLVLVRVSRGIGGGIGSFYRGPGLPQSSRPQPARAQLAGSVASFWTWGLRLLGGVLAAFGVYVLVVQLI